jgi:phospholipid/cholesterol/gamma-HCH transport system substrate-binding protein
MEKTHLEWKVGLFLVICLALVAGLLLLFSKGTTFLTSTYTLRLKTPNVGLLTPGAPALMAGVKIGHIDRIELDPGGKSVTLWVKILKRYPVRRDARFVTDQIGLLGDQFISVATQENTAPLFKDGDEGALEEPLNMQAVARSSMGLIQRVDQTVQKLRDVVGRVDRLILSEDTLTNVSDAVSNLRQFSEQAASAIEGLNQLVQSNRAEVALGVSNLVLFSEELHSVAGDLHAMVETNRTDIRATIQNARAASESVSGLTSDLESGKGLAGLLLKDEPTRAALTLLVSNLSVLSSNLNKHGLLYKPKKANAPVAPPAAKKF